MNKLLKWLSINKKAISGSIALFIYFVEEIFKLTEKLCLPNGLYYPIIIVLFLSISYSIHDKDSYKNQFIEELVKKEYMKQIDKLKKTIIIIEKLYEIVNEAIEEEDILEPKDYNPG